MHVSRRALRSASPIPREFFSPSLDAVITIDSFVYSGTVERYLSYLLQFVNLGDCIGVVGDAPDYLSRAYAREKPPAADENPIIWAVPRDNDGLIALFCLVARKR